MLINLYGNIINADNIIRVMANNSNYAIYFNGQIDASSAQERNFILITLDTIISIDNVSGYDVDILYVQKVINKLHQEELNTYGKASSK